MPITDGVCLHCGEALDAGFIRRAVLGASGTTVGGLHPECAARLTVGGINHLKGCCTCCGGTEPPDPPDMSLRDAARFAVLHWACLEWENGRWPSPDASH